MIIQTEKLFIALDKYKDKYGTYPDIYTKDENNNKVKIISHISKKNDLVEINYNNKKFTCGIDHKISSDKGVEFIREANSIKNIDGNIYPISKKYLDKSIVYDFEVDSDSHLYSLPDGSIHHNTELSDHLMDVMDIIDVEVKDTELYKYLKFKQENKDANDAIGFDITSKMINIFRELINKLESNIDTDGEEIKGNSRKWYWQWDGNVIYVSPRELDDMISGSIGLVVSKLIDFEGYDKTENYDDEDYLDFIDIIKETIYTKTNQLLSFIGEDKHDIDVAAMNNLYDFVKFQIESETFDEIMDVQSDNITSIKSMVEDSEYNFGEMLDYDELGDVIENYLGSVEPEEAISNISDVIDTIVNDYSATPTEFIDNIVGLYKVLNTVDYTKFSGKISANITQALLQRGLRSYAKSLLKIAIDSNRNFTKEINGHKYYKVLEDLSTRKNYFI